MIFNLLDSKSDTRLIRYQIYHIPDLSDTIVIYPRQNFSQSVQGRVGIELGKGEGTGVALFGPQFHHGELGRVGDLHELGGGERLGVKCFIAPVILPQCMLL